MVKSLTFGELSFFEKHAVIECFYGTHMSQTEIEELKKVLFQEFGNRKFGLIADRVNNYSVDMDATEDLYGTENLVAGAIVAYTLYEKMAALLEDKIVKGAPIEVFTNIDKATAWIIGQITEKEQSELVLSRC